jgi:head-tail adaptor
VSFDSLLTHTVSLVRRLDSGVDDDYGQAITDETVVSAVRASIQPKSDREAALVSQAGTAVSDHVIYIRPLDVSTADLVVHDRAACGLADDLPDGRYELIGTPAAAGLGHHLELDARLIVAPELELVPAS